MRIVVDTNVFISAVLFPQSIPSRAVELAVDVADRLFSWETIAELKDVLHRPKFDRYLVKYKRIAFFRRVIKDAIVIDQVTPLAICRDPDDDKFLSLAVAGKADAIITGDADLLALHPFRGVAILTPQQFVEQFATG